MKLFINKMDGAGPVDYTAALCEERPLRIERKLNKAAVCSALLDVKNTGLAAPVKHAQASVLNDAGMELFTGHVTSKPTGEYVGVGVAGSVNRLLITAASDAWLTNSIAAWSLAGASVVTHPVTEENGAWEMDAIPERKLRELATDVTLCGAREPVAMIQEMFTGDGTTAQFVLSETPFTESPSVLTKDAFDGPVIDTSMWGINDAGAYVSLTSAGVTMNGGNGFDGQTTVEALQQVEMGGALLVEASHVTLSAGSSGVLCGLYQGAISMGNLFAGFRVKVVSGVVMLVPMVSGAEVGTSFTVSAGHGYTLRLRTYCPEFQRVMRTYYAMADGVVHAFGGGLVEAPMRVTFEVQDLGLSSATPVTVLYDGEVASTPAKCVLVLANVIQIFGSIGGMKLSRPSGTWVVSTLPDGTRQTRLIGALGEGVDCSVDSTGKVLFYPGREPAPGEKITVFYRNELRAVSRMADAASVAEQAAMGLPGLARWNGRVRDARSSMDCDAAAQALLHFAVSRGAAESGKYVAVNPVADMQAGHVLQLASGADEVRALITDVLIEDQQCVPEVLQYTVRFANDWSEGLSLKLTDGVAADALAPARVVTAPASSLESLQKMTVVNATETVLQMDAGRDAVSGGGFEVRKRDWAFGPGVDSDLVLRSPVRSFEIPRVAKDERYFVRMYDGSDPPVYSRFSSAVFTHVPVG